MLSTATAGRALRRGHPGIWRTLVTESSVSDSASSLGPVDEQDRPARGKHTRSHATIEKVGAPRVGLAENTIYVRAWKHPDSMADAFAIVRAVEKKYGRLREFKWVRVRPLLIHDASSAKD